MTFISWLYPRQNRHSNIDKKESKPRVQVLLVVLERLNGQHPLPKRERERERHTPLVFELERQKRLSPKWDAQTRAGLLSSRPATVKPL